MSVVFTVSFILIHERFSFEEARYLSINHFNNTAIIEYPRFQSSREATRDCQSLQGDWKVQYAEFRGLGLDSGKKKTMCSNSTNTPIETLRVSSRASRLAGTCTCEPENSKYIGEIRYLDGVDPEVDNTDSVLACSVELEAEESGASDDIKNATMWYFSDKPEKVVPGLLPSRSILSYRKSDEKNFYRVVVGSIQIIAEGLHMIVDSDTYLVEEQYFDFTGDHDFVEISNKAMQMSCKSVRCLLSKRRSGLSDFTMATWLRWHTSGITYDDLGLILDGTFNEEFGRVRASEGGDGKQDPAFVRPLEGDEEDVTVISTYSAIILTSILALALLGAVISETARRKGWKCYGVDITCPERNRLFCQIYNKSRSSSDEDCLEDAKDLILVATSDRSGKKMRISVENRNEIHLLQKIQADDHAV